MNLPDILKINTAKLNIHDLIKFRRSWEFMAKFKFDY